MKILIGYYSETGNTKKIAEAIHEITSQNHTSVLKSIKEIDLEELKELDLIFLGSAIHGADVTKPVKKLLQNLPKSPGFKLAGFVTHSTYLPDTEDKKSLYDRWAGHAPKTFEREAKNKEIEYLGYFSCMGIPSPPIEKFIHNDIIEDEKEWGV